MTILDFVRTTRANLVLLILGIIIGALLGVGYSLTQPKVYAASASGYVTIGSGGTIDVLSGSSTAIYQMQLTPEQVITQWERVVNIHKKDTKFDPEYAFLLSLNNAEANYYYRIFNAEKPTTTADIDAIAYLVKFADEIKAYNKKIEGNDDNYMGYAERLEKGIIEVNYGELSNQLDLLFSTTKNSLNP